MRNPEAPKKLTLSEMQDIGGCRAIVKSNREVGDLIRLFMSGGKHILERRNDYIAEPKASGYRSVHLIYRYKSDKKSTYNGQRIEIQFRSPMQHAWATAVEVFGTVLRQSLKSSQGEKNWLRFFSLMGSAIARREGTPPVPKTPTKSSEFKSELNTLVKHLRVVGRLEALKAAGKAVTLPDAKDADYFLLVLNAETGELRIFGYRANAREEMSQHLEELERQVDQHPEIDPVVVSVEDLSQLERAYPNYYLDTDQFLLSVREAIR
jgi:hypothetical protein